MHFLDMQSMVAAFESRAVLTSETKAQSWTRKASKMHRDGYVAARPSLGARHIPTLFRKTSLPTNFFVWYSYLGSWNNLFTRIDCDL